MGKNKVDIFEGRTKEWDSNLWQGRSKRQVESNYKSMTVGCIGFFIVLLGIIIYGIFS